MTSNILDKDALAWLKNIVDVADRESHDHLFVLLKQGGGTKNMTVRSSLSLISFPLPPPNSHLLPTSSLAHRLTYSTQPDASSAKSMPLQAPSNQHGHPGPPTHSSSPSSTPSSSTTNNNQPHQPPEQQ